MNKDVENQKAALAENTIPRRELLRMGTLTLAGLAVPSVLRGTASGATSIAVINAGGAAVEGFAADFGYLGGSTAYHPKTIDMSAAPGVPQEVCHSERWGEFSYEFTNLAARGYEVALIFAEVYFSSPGSRKFAVSINSNTVLSEFDIVQTAGAANRALIKRFSTSPDFSGRILVKFIRGSVDLPKLSAIELLPGTASCETRSSLIFAPNSFWYTPLPASVSLHPNSANFVTDLLRQIRTYYGPNVGINTNAFSSPVYFPSADTPRIAVGQWNCQGKSSFPDPGLTNQWSSVPVPSYAQTADPQEGSGVYTDAEMTILQGDTLFEFWKARKTSTGQWQGCWGGRMDNASTSPGIWPFPYGASATGLPYIGGQVTAEELQSGLINHVIGISLVDLEAYTTFSWPAVRSDGHNPNHVPNRIPEGLRFRLDPNVNVDALNLHPVAKVIGRAAQKYGFVVWDKAGAVTLRFRNPKSYTQLQQPDPYPALFNGTPSYAILANFPWDRVQFLPMHYGKP
jgi:Malectin domain